MYNDRAKALWDTAVVEKKFGVRPDQLADYLALTGDASDNVPGVVGVGPKRASTLLKQHGTIEALLEAAPRMKKRRARVQKRRRARLLALLQHVSLCHVRPSRQPLCTIFSN